MVPPTVAARVHDEQRQPDHPADGRTVQQPDEGEPEPTEHEAEGDAGGGLACHDQHIAEAYLAGASARVTVVAA